MEAADRALPVPVEEEALHTGAAERTSPQIVGTPEVRAMSLLPPARPAVSSPIPRLTRPAARTNAPTKTSAISPFGRSRPLPIEEKKKPAGISSAATATPLRESQSTNPDCVVESASTWHTSARISSTPAWA